MGSYEQPKAYFTLADQNASRNSRLSGASSARDFKSYMAQKANSIRAVKKGREAKREQQTNGFWGQYQTASKHLSQLESVLGGFDGRNAGDQQGTTGKANEEITAFRAQIQAQLEKIGEDLTKQLNSSKGQDMSEGEIQGLIGSSIGRVEKLQSTIVNVMAAAEEYYNAEEDSILASSNPELQLLFDGLKDDAIQMIFSEDAQGEWVVFPISSDDSRTANKFIYDNKEDTNSDGVVDEKDRMAQVEAWSNNPANKLYRKEKHEVKDVNGKKPGEPGYIKTEKDVTEYNYIKDIGPLNLTQIERDFQQGKNGTKGSFQGNKDGKFFDTQGDYKTLVKDFDSKFKTFLQDNAQSLQAIRPTADFSGLERSPNTAKDATVSGKNAKNIKPEDQNYFNTQQLDDFLSNNPIGQEFLEQFANSETLNSDLTGWLGKDIDLLGTTYGTKDQRQTELRNILKEHALKTIPQPLENKPADGVTDKATQIPY